MRVVTFRGVRELMLVLVACVGATTVRVNTVSAAPVLALREIEAGYGGDGIIVTPDGQFVYTNQGPGPTSAIAAFRRNGTTGSLTFIEQHTGLGANWWRGSASPDGRHLYLGASGGSGDGRVIVYAIDPVTGQLTHLQDVIDGVPPNTGLARTTDVAVSPDGKFVYSAAAGDLHDAHQPSSLAAFVRDDDPMSPDFGTLSFLGAELSPPSTSGSWYARAIMSPDGNTIYVTAYEDSAVSVFNRDPLSGLATYAGRVKQGENGVVGFYRPAGMALSPNGLFFTVASWGDGVITTLKRNVLTGDLSFSEVEPLVGGYAQPAELMMGVGATRLFGVTWDRFVSVFLVDPVHGGLTRHEQHRGGIGGDPGLENLIGTVAPAVSPDGRNLYVTMTTPPAIAVFEITCGNGVLDAGEACDDGNSLAGDGCSSDCEVEECWNCSGAGVDTCAPQMSGVACASDGNPCRDDVCDGTGTCTHPAAADGIACDDHVACTTGDECRGGECRGTAPTCGDGTLTPGCEQCDDGNLLDGDGCAADCSLFEKTVSATLDSYGTLSTDTESDGATPASPIELAITTPNAGFVSIHLSGGQPLPGDTSLGFFGTRIDVEAPENIAAGDGATSGVTPESRPLVFVYTVDASILPAGVDAATIQIPRNGVPAPPCNDSSGAAVPDPCVSERVDLPDGDVQVTVLSTHASKWNVAAVVTPSVTSPTPTPTPQLTVTRTPAPQRTCAASPIGGCQPAARSKLAIHNDADDRKDKLLVKLDAGVAPTLPAAFGQPTQSTAYALCLYDDTGLKGVATIPPGPPWTSTSNLYRYVDPNGVNAGVRKAMLKRTHGGTKLFVKAQGTNQPDVIDVPMSGTVTVQVVNSDDSCWQSTFTAAAANSEASYKASY